MTTENGEDEVERERTMDGKNVRNVTHFGRVEKRNACRHKEWSAGNARVCGVLLMGRTVRARQKVTTFFHGLVQTARVGRRTKCMCVYV